MLKCGSIFINTNNY